MIGGYDGWKDEEGDWRFWIAILPEGNTAGQMIYGLSEEGGSKPENKGLTESEFRQVMATRYCQIPLEIDNAVARVKGGKTLNDT